VTDGLTGRDRKGIVSVLEACPKIRRAVLFGSRAIGTYRGASDLDLALEGDGIKLTDLVAINAGIGRLQLPFEADFVIRAKINNPELEKHIREYGRVFYERKEVESGVGGWRQVSAGDIATSLAIGPFGSRMKTDCYVEHGVPIIRGNNISDTKALKGEFVFLSEQMAKGMASCNVYDGDLVFPHRGLIGEVGIVTGGEDAHFFISSSLMKLTPNREIADPLFYFYYFRSPEGRHELLKNASQVGTPGIATPLTSLRSTRVPLPPLSDQRAIASVLGALDDKIELNRRMNETLEATARALFQNRFVDATQAGLPKGWHEGTLGEVAENPRRGVQPDDMKPATPYIGLEHMPRRCTALSDWGHADELESNKFEFKRGEILFGKLRPYFHKVGVAPLNGVCSTDILVVTPKEPAWFGFVLGHVSSVELVNHTNAASTGTKMPRTNWNDIARFEVALPPESLASEFTDRIRPMIDRIIANIHEARTLAALRDALLPKLLSGELRVQHET
jgi:type I restriction enzyme S subunit